MAEVCRSISKRVLERLSLRFVFSEEPADPQPMNRKHRVMSSQTNLVMSDYETSNFVGGLVDDDDDDDGFDGTYLRYEVGLLFMYMFIINYDLFHVLMYYVCS